jgi:hypothetical protein
MPDYMIRDFELLDPEPLRQCSSVLPGYMMRVRATTSRASEIVEQSDARVHDKELKLIHPERLRQCSREMPDYMIREFDRLHPERLRQGSRLMPEYMIRDLDLLHPERL